MNKEVEGGMFYRFFKETGKVFCKAGFSDNDELFFDSFTNLKEARNFKGDCKIPQFFMMFLFDWLKERKK